MKKIYLTTVLLLAGASTQASKTKIKMVTRANEPKVSSACRALNVFKATKNHVGNQNKAYYLKGSVGIFGLFCFVKMSSNGAKQLYKKFKKKGLTEAMAYKVQKTFTKKPTWYDRVKSFSLLVVAGFISFLLLLSLKGQYNDVQQMYSNLNKESLKDLNKVTVVNDDNETQDIE